MIKLDWSTRALQVEDLDGDGLDDLAVINNDTAQIELLYQNDGGVPSEAGQQRLQRDRWDPVLEDGDLKSTKITVGVPLFDLGVGDLNNDGRPDLAYTSRSVPLTVRYQDAEGQWLETQEFDGFEALGWQGTLKLADLNGDGLSQIVLLSGDALRIFSQDADGRLLEPDVYFVTGENPFNLIIADVTGDGLDEICYITKEGKQAFVMREQLADGGFGGERRFVLDRPVRMVAPMLTSGRGASRFVSVDSRSGSLEFFEIESVQNGDDKRALEGVQPIIYPLFKETNAGARYGFADLDGDGEPDLQVANPAGSEVIVFLKNDGRYEASKRFPSFSAISSLAGGRFFQADFEGVVALSREEGTLGYSEFDARQRLSFPRQLNIAGGDPLVCQAVDLDADGFDELALLLEDAGDRHLVIAQPEDRSDPASAWELIREIPVESPRRQPDAMQVVDIFGDRGPGLMLFVPREAPVFLAPVAGGAPYELEPVGEDSSVRKSLLQGILPAQVSEIDVDGDGSPELVAARTGFARAIRFSDDQLEMVDQFNARRSGDELSAVIPNVADGMLEGLVFYVEKAGELQFLSRDADGVLRYRRSEQVGPITLSGWMEFAGAAPADAAHLLYGEDRFWYFAPEAAGWKRAVGDNYETELEDVFFSHVVSADFDRDGLLELIAVDGNENVVEILGRDADGWKSLMYWEIFDQNMHYQGRTGAKLEPRETIRADLNGDGKLDFGFLIHDRILYYPQE
ncbi:MAG: hypothetical protein GVY36_15195 [Verrucomicrobia bacterium]|nr:hypothetical protein [Verrucomicrobiota bacterium]